MSRIIVPAAAALLVVAACTPATAQAGRTSNPDSLLYKRSTLIFSFAMSGDASTSTSVSIGNVETKASGFGGWIAYQNWVRPDLAATIRVGGTAVEVQEFVGVVGVETRTAVCAPMLFGVRFHPRNLRVGDSIFPFVAVSAGPYFGVETYSGVGAGVNTETTVEMALGANGAAGFDWYLGRHFNIAIGVGYNAITNYSQDIGSKDNHSSAEFTMSFGWVF